MKPVRTMLIAVMVILAAVRAASPLTTTVVLGHSMEPTIRPGSFYVLDRGYYRSQILNRGDVIVHRLQNEILIKRVHALPGDRVELVRDVWSGESDLIDANEAARLRKLHSLGRVLDRRLFTLTVPPGHCYVVGDNRRESMDSRDFGPVPISDILGRAML